METNPFETNENQDQGLALQVKIPSKVEVASQIESIVAHIKEEDDRYLDRYLQAKAGIEVLTGVIDAIKNDAREEIENLGDKESKYLGCTVSVKNLGDKYTFDHNQEWVDLKEQEADVKSKIKALEESMINATKYAEIFDKDGFKIPPAVLKEHGGRTIAVTLSKK